MAKKGMHSLVPGRPIYVVNRWEKRIVVADPGEFPDGGPARVAMVAFTVILTLVVAAVLVSWGKSPPRRRISPELYSTAARARLTLLGVATVLGTGLHFADNIGRPVFYYTPAWIYNGWGIAPMDGTVVTVAFNVGVLAVYIGRTLVQAPDAVRTLRRGFWAAYLHCAIVCVGLLHFAFEPFASFSAWAVGTILGEVVPALLMAACALQAHLALNARAGPDDEGADDAAYTDGSAPPGPGDGRGAPGASMDGATASLGGASFATVSAGDGASGDGAGVELPARRRTPTPHR